MSVDEPLISRGEVGRAAPSASDGLMDECFDYFRRNVDCHPSDCGRKSEIGRFFAAMAAIRATLTIAELRLQVAILRNSWGETGLPESA